MGAEQRRKRGNSSKKRRQGGTNPEVKAIISGGGAGVAVLGVATLGMIVWMFVPPGTFSDQNRAVALNDDQPAQPARDPVGEQTEREADLPGELQTEPASDSGTSVDAETPGTAPDPVALAASAGLAADHPLVPFLRAGCPDDVRWAAFDNDNGHLALLGPWEKAIGIVSPEQLDGQFSMDDVALVEMEGNPSTIEYKPLSGGGRFLVGQAAPDALLLVDPVAREVVDTIAFSGGYPDHIACSSDPGVAEAWTVVKGGRRVMHLIDLADRTVTQTWTALELRDFAVSPDGETVYFRVNHRPTGRGAVRPRRAEDLFSWFKNPQMDYEEPDQRYVVDPKGQFVVSGTRVFSPDFGALQHELEFEPQAILPDGPWAAGIGDLEFVVGSMNDGRVVSRMPLPLDWHSVRRQRDRERCRELNCDNWAELLPGQLFADALNDRFLLTTERYVFSFPLDELDLPAPQPTVNRHP